MRILTCATLLACSLLTGCATVGNVMGNDTLSLNKEAAMAYQQKKREYEIDTTSQTSKRIHRIYNQMVPWADRANNTGVKFDWDLVVFRDDQLNAWAMPGGKIAFFTGIVEKLNLTDDEIAAIMGHEMAHALEEHGKEKANFDLMANFGLVALHMTGFGAVGEVAMATQYGGATAYSRSKEREADRLGLHLMAQSGYNPAAGISFWNKVQAESKKKTVIDKLDAVLSTHPTDEDRLKTMQALQAEVLPTYQAALKGRAHEYTLPVNIKKNRVKK